MITAVISITSRMNIETKRDDKNCDVEVLLRRRRQKTVTKYLFFSIGDHMCGWLAGDKTLFALCQSQKRLVIEQRNLGKVLLQHPSKSEKQPIVKL